jgi:acyl-CoA thioester hydrolase
VPGTRNMRKLAFGWSREESACQGATTIRVRYAETDAMGWVYYGCYFVYFEIGRTELMREVWRPYAEIEKDGSRLPVVSTGCRFLSGARYDDVLRIVTSASLLTAYRVRFDYRVFREEEMLCEGFTEHCFVNRDDKITRVPQELAERIAGR